MGTDTVVWRLSSTRRAFVGRCQCLYTNKVHGNGCLVMDIRLVLFYSRSHPR